MQATTENVTNNFTTAKFALDRTELMRLQEMGIITGKAYIYLALKLTYNTLNISVDTESFCEDWQVTESDLAIALGQLQKKGALAPVHHQLELELFLMNNAVDYAITVVRNGYAQAIEQGCDKFVCQLTKNNQGFSYVEIQRIKEAASKFSFSIPTHISILPKGKKPTNNRLFDGLQTIYAKEVEKCDKQ